MAVGILVIAVGAGLMLFQGPEQPVTPPLVRVAGPSASVPQSLTGRPPQNDYGSERSKLPLRRGVIEVRDEEGSLLAEAGVWEDDGDTEVLVRSQQQFLGATGSDGTFSLDLGEADRLALVVGKAGFLSTRCTAEVARATHVSLRRGGRLEFLCKDLADAPVAGVLVGVSRSILPPEWHGTLTAEGAIPGAIPRIALITGTSDAAGRAVLSGVPEGSQAWDVFVPGYFLVNGPGLRPPDTTGVTCPGPSYVLTFAPFGVAACVVRHDEQVWYRGSPGADSLGVAWGGRQEEQVEQALRRQHPNAIVSVLPLATFAGRPVLELDVLLRERGRHAMEVPYVSWREWEAQGPVVIDARELAVREPRCGRIDIRIRNGDGQLLEAVGLELHALGAGGGSAGLMSMPRTGETHHCPVGRYRVMAREPSVQNLLPQDTVVEVGEAVGDAATVWEVQLTRTLFPVRLQKRVEPARWSRPGGNVILRFENGATRALALDAQDRADVYVAAGRVTAELRWNRARVGPVEFMVGGQGSVERQIVELLVRLE